MPKSADTTLICPACNTPGVVRHLPKEVGRQFDKEEISVPDGAVSKKVTVALLRITYEREFFCAGCGLRWTETYTVDKQHHL